MSWLSIGLGALQWILSLFTGKKDDKDADRKFGETQGKTEQQNADLRDYIATEAKADSASAGVDSSPSGMWNDPNNRARKPRP